MTPAERALLARLRLRSSTLQPEISQRLLMAYDTIRATLTEAEILQAMRSGAIDKMITELLSDAALEPAFAPLRATIDTRTLEAGASWAKTLPHTLVGTFDPLNPFVIQAVRDFDRFVISRLADEVRETVRSAVVAGLEAGKNPRTIARSIPGKVGLSANQARAVETFRAELLTSDRSALNRVLGKGVIRRPDGSKIVRTGHAAGQGLTKRDIRTLDRILGDKSLNMAQVDRMVESYRKRLLALNVEANARSIALDANRLAQRLSWIDAISKGLVDRNRLRRTWLATRGPQGDGRNRPEHLELHGVTVGFDELYPNGQLVPGETDYQCRCGERFTLLPAARIAA